VLEILEDLSRRIPGGSLKAGSQFLESLWWYFYMRETNGRFYLYLGDRPFFSSDSRDALDAFILGAAFAYGSLPQPILEEYRVDSRRHFTPAKERPSIPGLTPL
jgi:hypothetical protein